MTKKIIKTRQQQLIKTEEEWLSINPVLKDGETCYVRLSDGVIRTKVGDGITVYNNLPFQSFNTINYAGATVDGGAATSAKKLETARTLSFDCGISATATFDGSADTQFNLKTINGAYVTWGVGKNYSGSSSVIDAALVPEIGANRLAFMPAECIVYEYSTDGGETWEEFSSDTANYYKTAMTVSESIGTGIFCLRNEDGGSQTGITTDCKYRITIKSYTQSGNCVLYCLVKKIMFNINTQGAQNCTVKGQTFNKKDAKWYDWFEAPVSGWSGWNTINAYERRMGVNDGANSGSYDTSKIRFIFSIGGLHSNTAYSNNLSLLAIRLFSSQAWNFPSNLARYGRIYNMDAYGNCSFPKGIKGLLMNSTAKIFGGKGYININTTNWTLTIPKDTILSFVDNSYYVLPSIQTFDLSFDTNKTTALKLFFNTQTNTFKLVPYTTNGTWGDQIICTLRVPSVETMNDYPVVVDISAAYTIDGVLYGVSADDTKSDKSELENLKTLVSSLQAEIDELKSEKYIVIEKEE